MPLIRPLRERFRLLSMAMDRRDRRIVADLCASRERLVWFERPAAFFARRGPILFFCEMALILLVRRASSSGVGMEDLRGLTVAVTAAVCAKIVIDPIARKVRRRRPFVSMEFRPLVRKDPQDPSFPSNHAGGAFALATALSLYFPQWALASWMLAIVLSMARVYAGVHYPSDVAAGAAIGALSGVVFSLILGLR